MKKACRYCGKYHDRGEMCPKKPKYFCDASSAEYKFRSSFKWRVKREEIKKRDNYQCLVCRANLSGTIRRLNPYELSVHHITPLREDISMGLNDGNLITLCRYHHEQAESGKIPRKILFDLVKNLQCIPPYPLDVEFSKRADTKEWGL